MGALAEFFHYADDLMSWDDGGFARREFAFDDVQIGAANSAHFHAHEDFACGGARIGSVGEVEWVGIDWCGRTQDGGFHLLLTPALSLHRRPSRGDRDGWHTSRQVCLPGTVCCASTKAKR